MNIVKEELKDLTTLIKVTVSPADYAEAVETQLRQYKRKANVPGFRTGMVPMGVVNKLYRKGVLAEEAYRIASKACFDFLQEHQLNYIGEVLPSEQQQPLDFDTEGDYEFVFEVGVAPEVKIALSSKDSVDRYVIKPTREMHEGYRTNFLRRFGQLVDVEKVTADEALEVNLDNATMNVADAYVGLIGMDERERKPFIDKKVGDKMPVDLNELYKNSSQRAAILQVKEHELEGIDPKFELTITRIRKFAEPAIDAEFFQTAFPEGNVTSAKEFDKFIDAQIAGELVTHTDQLFDQAFQQMLIDKARLTLPEEFLKRWLIAVNEGRFTREQVDAEFAPFLRMMQWNLIRTHYAAALDLKVTPEQLLDEAKANARQQFAQYGMASVPDDTLTPYAQQMLDNKQEEAKIQDALLEKAVVAALVPQITVVEKSVSPDEFGKKMEALNK